MFRIPLNDDDSELDPWDNEFELEGDYEELDFGKPSNRLPFGESQEPDLEEEIGTAVDEKLHKEDEEEEKKKREEEDIEVILVYVNGE